MMEFLAKGDNANFMGNTYMRKEFLTATVVFCLSTLTGIATAAELAGKRLLHIDSYHEGNFWNDAIADAVRETLTGTGVELKVIRMDTKRNPSEEFKKEAALRAKAAIEEFKPDIVTASDDNASKYLIMPYFKDVELPFVFCGVNWDASVYGFPYQNVTGMVEVSPAPKIIELMRQYATGDRIGYLTEDTPTKRKEQEFHRKMFGIEYHKTYLANSFAQWKAGFLKAQEEVDMLIILGVAAIEDWDDEAAGEFALEHTRIPSGTDFGWLMHLAMVGVGKSPQEQGRWAAKAALKVLEGVSPAEIPLAYNKEGKLFFNKRIAARLGVSEAPPLAELIE